MLVERLSETDTESEGVAMTPDPLAPLLERIDDLLLTVDAVSFILPPVKGPDFNRDCAEALRDCRLALQRAAQEHEQLKQLYAEYGATEDDLAPFRRIAALAAQIQALRLYVEHKTSCEVFFCADCRHSKYVHDGVLRWLKCDECDCQKFRQSDCTCGLAALLGTTPVALCVKCQHSEREHGDFGFRDHAFVGATPAQTGEQ